MVGANTAVELPAGATLRLIHDTKLMMTNWSVLPAAVASGHAYTFATFVAAANVSSVIVSGAGAIDGGGQWCLSWAKRPHGGPEFMRFDPKMDGATLFGADEFEPAGRPARLFFYA